MAIEGDTVVVGAKASTAAAGSVYVFLTTDGWVTQTEMAKKLKAPTARRGAQFELFRGDRRWHRRGRGLPTQPTACPRAPPHLFQRRRYTHYDQVAGVTADAAAGDYFGMSVAIGGGTVVVGAYQVDKAASMGRGLHLRGAPGSDDVALAVPSLRPTLRPTPTFDPTTHDGRPVAGAVAATLDRRRPSSAPSRSGPSPAPSEAPMPSEPSPSPTTSVNAPSAWCRPLDRPPSLPPRPKPEPSARPTPGPLAEPSSLPRPAACRSRGPLPSRPIIRHPSRRKRDEELAEDGAAAVTTAVVVAVATSTAAAVAGATGASAGDPAHAFAGGAPPRAAPVAAAPGPARRPRAPRATTR